MPIYEYRCERCGHEFEREQRITEEPIRRCPACRSLRAKRLISLTSFVLKGGGWYKDLYSSSRPGARPDGKGEAAGSGEGESARSESKTSKPETSKPETRKPAKSEPGKGSGASKGSKAA